MKKLIGFGIGAVLIAVIIFVLERNKTISEARAAASQEVERSITVSTAFIKRETIGQSLSLVGTTVANNDVPLVSETSGRVVAVMAKVGDYKTAESVIIQVDDELKKANFETAKVNVEKAKKDLERYEELYKQGAISAAQIEQYRYTAQSAESQFVIARRAYTDTKITTPISGLLSERKVDIGAYISQGMLVGNVVDISRLKVKLNVAETDVFKLKEGDKVTVEVDVFAGKVFEGKILSIGSKGDEAHTFPVEILVENRDKTFSLKAGMFARVTFGSVSERSALFLPREALLGSVKNPIIYVVENGVAVKRTPVLGSEAGRFLEVLSGLKEGDEVVIAGQNNLREGYPVFAIKE